MQRPHLAFLRLSLITAAVAATAGSFASASELQTATDLCRRASKQPDIISACSVVIGLSKDLKLLERAYNRRGMAEEQTGQFDPSASDYSNVIRLNPSVAGYFDNRMRAYKGAGHLDLALQDANTAVRMAPTYAFPLNGRGAVYFDKGDYRAAVRDFSAALAFNESDASIHVARGRALVRVGDVKAALRDFEAARAIDPANEPALRERGMVYAQLGRIAEARSDLSAAVAISPSDADAAVALRQLDSSTKSLNARVALVIGNSVYANIGALANTTSDADAVANGLRSAGVTVDQKDNLTREQLIDTLSKFSTEAENADWAIIYYAGHGMELNGINYVIPTDARLATDTSVQYEAVPLALLQSSVEGAHKLRIVLVDACRENPFTKRFSASRSVSRGLGPQAEP